MVKKRDTKLDWAQLLIAGSLSFHLINERRMLANGAGIGCQQAKLLIQGLRNLLHC